MAGNQFSAELLISTAKANKEMQAMNQQVQALDKSLAGLGKTLQANQKDLDAAVKGISSIVQASRQASQASEESAKAKLAEARAQAELAKAENASNLGAARVERERSVVAVNNSTVAYRNARTEALEFAKSQRAVQASTDGMGNSLANQRYLLYDVGATYRTLGLAASALPTAAVAAAAAYEKSFAQVIRVSGATSEQTTRLREDLKQLATDIPLSFAELSDIAKIGGQMNIGADQLAAFTETVAKFVATADGATIDSSTQAFGRLANLFANEMTGDEQAQFFERIGSAISYTADNAVTSEAKITAMLEKIAPIAAQSGMAAEEVVGLASALSSVGQQPYLSSGFLTRFFGNLNKEVASGGKSLSAYADVLNVTVDEFRSLYANDPTQVLMRMTEELSKMDKFEVSNVLGDLGIKGVNDQKVVQALAANFHVLKDAMDDSSEAYAKSSYLDESSQGIFNTLIANVTKLMNSLMNLGDTVGSGIVPVLSDFVGMIQWAVDGLTNLANTVPAVKTVLAVLTSIGSVAGVFFALKSAAAFFNAGLVTLTHVSKQAAGGTLTFSTQLRNLATAQLTAKGMSDAAAASYIKQVGAVRALGAATALTTVQTRALNVHMLSGGTASKSFGAGIKGAGSVLASFAGGPIGIAVGALALLGGAWFNASQDAKAASQEIVNAFKLSGEAGADALGKEFGEKKIGFFEADNIKLVGKTYGELADTINLSMSEISTAISGGSESTDALVNKLRAEREELLNTEGHSQRTLAYGMLADKLATYASELGTSEDGAERAAQANIGLKDSNNETEDSLDRVTEKTDDYARALNDAISAAFGLTDAQGQVNAALESLGAGIQKSGSIGVGSADARSNLADFQKALSMQAAFLQQQLEAGKISAESAAMQYSQFAQGLMTELSNMGVDTTGLISDVETSIAKVNELFSQQDTGMTIPVSVDSSQAVMETDAVLSWMSDYLTSNPQLAQVGLTGDDEVSDRVYNLVSYISEATGMDFAAVVRAITTPAGKETENVTKFMMEAVNQDFMAYINADTSAAAQNVQNFALFARDQLAEIDAQAAGVAAALGGPAGMAVSAGFRAARVLATPAQTIAKANKAAAPTFKPLNQGYDDAARKAANAGNKAAGAGKKAKKAGGDAAKGSKDASKALQDQKKDWDELEKQISGYASRVGSAFSNVTAKQTGVAEAKDEYYTILNGIQERLENQKKAVADLRAENKSLNAERRVQLNDAAKLEKMAKYADQMGNSERAKVYRDEANALKTSAAETANKVKANEKEAKSIEKGMGNLKGYSKEAIENRKELRNLRDASLKVSEAYAASGASAKTVARETENWTKKAKDHGKQLGYSKSDVDKVLGSTKTYVSELKKVPKTIETNIKAKNNAASGVNAAKKTLSGIPSSKSTSIKAKGSGIGSVNSSLNSAARTRTATVKGKFTLTAAERKKFRTMGAIMNGTGNLVLGGSLLAISNMYKGGKVKGFASGGLVPGTPPVNPREDNIMATLDGDGMAAIRSGEYIHRQPAVDYYGTDIMDKLNRMEIPRYALGGAVGANKSSGGNEVSVIELGSESIQSIARLVNREVALYADNQLLARSVQKGFDAIAQQGGVLN